MEPVAQNPCNWVPVWSWKSTVLISQYWTARASWQLNDMLGESRVFRKVRVLHRLSDHAALWTRACALSGLNWILLVRVVLWPSCTAFTFFFKWKSNKMKKLAKETKKRKQKLRGAASSFRCFQKACLEVLRAQWLKPVLPFTLGREVWGNSCKSKKHSQCGSHQDKEAIRRRPKNHDWV